MELLYTLPALILALAGLIWLRKELDQEEKQHLDTIDDYIDIKQELKLERKSNSANQGWNTKYRKTIEELEEKNQDQADTIKRLINKKWK